MAEFHLEVWRQNVKKYALTFAAHLILGNKPMFMFMLQRMKKTTVNSI